MIKQIRDILEENSRRNELKYAKFNPVTGEGAILDRVKFELSDFSIPVQYIPQTMMSVPLVKQLKKAGSIRKFLTDGLRVEYNDADKEKVVEKFIRIRFKHDFCFWAYTCVYIKQKGEGSGDVNFKLNNPQKKIVLRFEKKRLAGKPIRLILLKARQWGGSTVTQIYMAWLQLVHKVGLNSFIVGHLKDTSIEVKDMFDRMIKAYPMKLLYEFGEAYEENAPKMVGVGNSGNIHRIPQRNCKIKIGTAEKPDSARGGDYNLVHCTEVGLWKKQRARLPKTLCVRLVPVSCFNHIR